MAPKRGRGRWGLGNGLAGALKRGRGRPSNVGGEGGAGWAVWGGGGCGAEWARWGPETWQGKGGRCGRWGRWGAVGRACAGAPHLQEGKIVAAGGGG